MTKRRGSFDRRSFLRGAAILAAAPFAVSEWGHAQQPGARRFDPGAIEAFRKSRRIAVLAGVANYSHVSGIPPLRYPGRDVDEFAEALSRLEYETYVLKDNIADRDSVLQRLESIAAQLKDRGGDGTIVFYFSGHGWADRGANFLATYDARADRLASTGLKVDDVVTLLQQSGAQRQMIFLDACRSPAGKPVNPRRVFQSFNASQGTAMLFASKAGTVSYENDALRHGVFSHFLIRAAQGEARGSDGLLTFNDIADWVTRQVDEFVLQGSPLQLVYREGATHGDFLVGVPDGPSTTVPTVKLRLHGSTTIGERPTPDSPSLAEALVVAYLNALALKVTRAFPTVGEGAVTAVPEQKALPEFDILARGSGAAFVDLANGSAEIGMSSRRFDPGTDKAAMQRFGDLSQSGSTEFSIGRDGIVLIVNRNSRVGQLTLAQVQSIFCGETTNWSAVGGDPGPIRLYSRPWRTGPGVTLSGTAEIFIQKVMTRDFGYGPRQISSAARIIDASTELSEAVAGDEQGIGYVGLPYVDGTKGLRIADVETTRNAGAVINRPLGFYAPSPCSISRLQYPLARLLYLYLPGNSASQAAREFAEFAVSKPGQDVVAQIGFVSQNMRTDCVVDTQDPDRNKLSPDPGEPTNMVFLFESGDAGAVGKVVNQSLTQLELFVSQTKPTDRFILLGYTDNIGDRAHNLILSQRRAEFVKGLLESRGRTVVSWRGLGQDSPIQSNDTEDGRKANRRVEVIRQVLTKP